MSVHGRRWIRLVRLGAHVVTGIVKAGVLRGCDALAPMVARRLRQRWVPAWLGRAAAILGVDVVLTGLPVAGPALFVANHVSWLDILILAAGCRGDFVAKAELRSWPLMGWLAGVAGTVFVARGRADSQLEASRALFERLAEGGRVVLFPEGTTSEGDRVRAFRRRLFQPALAAGVVVQPIALSYRLDGGDTEARVAFVGDDDFPGHCWRLLGARRIVAGVHFLACQHPPHVGVRDLAGRCEAAVKAALTGPGMACADGFERAVTSLSSSPPRLPASGRKAPAAVAGHDATL